MRKEESLSKRGDTNLRGSLISQEIQIDLDNDSIMIGNTLNADIITEKSIHYDRQGQDNCRVNLQIDKYGENAYDESKEFNDDEEKSQQDYFKQFKPPVTRSLAESCMMSYNKSKQATPMHDIKT